MLELGTIFEQETHSDFYFIQVGANTGYHGDPIYPYIQKYDWKGVFIEPCAKPFGKLKKLYQNKEGYIFEQCVIGETNGDVDFFITGRKEFLCSLSRDATSHLRGRDKKNLVSKIQVPSLTLSSLIEKHNIERFDLLQVDAEGHDDMIVKQIQDLKIKPKIINFEYTHFLETDEKRMESLVAVLKENGYNTIDKSSEDNMVCVRDNDIV
jgi:FkbM family methyltransferase